MSSDPSYSEWVAKFCKSVVTWCEAPESTTQLDEELPDGAAKLTIGGRLEGVPIVGMTKQAMEKLQ